MNLLLLSLFVFITSVAGVGIVRWLAVRYDWIAQPRKERLHNNKTTALHGGIGFYPAFLIGLIVTFVNYFPHNWLALWTEIGWIRQGIALGVGALLMFMCGWLDDLKEYRPTTKLLVQLIAASLFIMAGAVIPVTQIQILNMLITYFWFIGIINAVNMLDNMDGLSSGVVFLAVGTVVILSVFTSPTELLAIPIALSLMAALLGFWIYNRPPASIFMGDSGSLFIGYVLASLAIPNELNGYFGIVKTNTISILALIIPATILSIAIFDTTLVTITRKWRAERASQGGLDHVSHRLLSLGFKDKQVLWIFYSFALFAGFIAVVMQRYIDYALLLFSSFVIIMLLLGIYLNHKTVRRAKDEMDPPTWTQIISYFHYKWYVSIILLDLVLIVVCYYAAYFLRFDGVLSYQVSKSILNTLPLVIPTCLLAFFISGIYRVQWDFISVPDISRYVFGIAGGVILSLATLVIFNRFEMGQSRGAYLIFGLLLFLVIIATRLSFRFFDHMLSIPLKNIQNRQCQPILIYGAGKGGKILLEEIFSNPEFKTFGVIGFIDDNAQKRQLNLSGLPIKSLIDWKDSLKKEVIPEIWISSKLISIDKIREFEKKEKISISIRRMMLKLDILSLRAKERRAVPDSYPLFREKKGR